MLAFGVPENYDTTGNYIDSKMANWSMMVNPRLDLQPGRVPGDQPGPRLTKPTGPRKPLGAQEFNPSPAAVPEPTTVAMWSLAALAFAVSSQPSGAGEPLTLNPIPAWSES